MITAPKKRKMNPMLLNVLLISGGVHAIALFILGSITVYKYIIPDDAQFEEPPAVEEEQPPPDVKIEIKQQAAPQAQSMNNLRMKQVGNIAVRAVDVQLPNMQESFTVSTGLGGFSGGALLGGTRGSIGIGMSDVSVFGLKTRAERILFVIDANRQMVTDAKGGLNSYKVIKNEITDMVANLSTGTLFNVMLQDRRKTMLFKNNLVPAGADIHMQLVKWISPINSNASKPGLEGVSAARQPKLTTFPEDEIQQAASYSGDRGNETAFLTQYALEQNVDAIFFITGYHRGFERIRRQPNERENKEWQRTTSSRKYQQQLEEHKKEIPKMEEKIKKELARQNAERKSKGQPPRVLAQRYGVYSNARELDLKWETPHPGWQPAYWVDERDVEKYFSKVIDTLYTDKGGQAPSINVILFLAGDEKFSNDAEKSLNSYVRSFSGKNRVIRGEDEIKSARSSKNTKN
ncbi:hypothetical protein QEH59_13900 [Coraliomargarita sp. SDUM461004]|uniref:VWFA domain-containing protein n=1 Tax=Thalassobacterium sedimentorum TaxID=3041258 RepID=A0ABU1AL25_9BACT|nr:hypothetical protein [Coraliomargarita sp. SDUM461004]MDQ8195522.1 hypothetical protein [Coraliomargarita sp. SDUM461004]